MKEMPDMSEDLVRAAQYVRMSTEHQQYSTENQADVIRDYAARRGIQIVRTFCDAGKSGLRLEGRDGLRALLDTVQRGTADFSMILVYDVSRWGRFQDADASAYYEYICRQAGITVQYCAEQFENDGTPAAAIIKSVKRVMAAEYSRELSAKVFKGQCRLVELGFHQGAAPGYGLRRLLLDPSGRPKGELQPGEQKSLQTDRVILVPGPTEERVVVRRIYRLFVREGRKEGQIARELNAHGVPAGKGREWTGQRVRALLTNEKYIGNNVYNRISFKLKQRWTRNPPNLWVRRDGAFEALVDPGEFAAAQARFEARRRHFSDEELLTKLQELAERMGRLSGRLIDMTEGMPPSARYRRRFGGLAGAYQRLDFPVGRDFAFVEVNRRLRALRRELIEELVRSLEARGGTVTMDPWTGLLWVNGMLSVAVQLARCRSLLIDGLRWVVQTKTCHGPGRSRRPPPGFVPRPPADLMMVVRMDAPNQAPFDYFLMPTLDIHLALLRLKEDNGLLLDRYRHTSLEGFYRLAETVRVGSAA